MQPPAKIVPFRGEYYELKASRSSLCRNLIYPYPIQTFVSRCALYAAWSMELLSVVPTPCWRWRVKATHGHTAHGRPGRVANYGGFVKLATKFWRQDWARFIAPYPRQLFVRALSRLVPDLKIDDITPGRAVCGLKPLTRCRWSTIFSGAR